MLTSYGSWWEWHYMKEDPTREALLYCSFQTEGRDRIQHSRSILTMANTRACKVASGVNTGG